MAASSEYPASSLVKRADVQLAALTTPKPRSHASGGVAARLRTRRAAGRAAAAPARRTAGARRTGATLTGIQRDGAARRGARHARARPRGARFTTSA